MPMSLYYLYQEYRGSNRHGHHAQDSVKGWARSDTIG